PASRQSVVVARAARMPGASRRKGRDGADPAAARPRAGAGGDPDPGILLLPPDGGGGGVGCGAPLACISLLRDDRRMPGINVLLGWRRSSQGMATRDDHAFSAAIASRHAAIVCATSASVWARLT